MWQEEFDIVQGVSGRRYRQVSELQRCWKEIPWDQVFDFIGLGFTEKRLP
jgi:hypothetical protein